MTSTAPIPVATGDSGLRELRVTGATPGLLALARRGRADGCGRGHLPGDH